MGETKNPVISRTMWGLLIAFIPDAVSIIEQAEGSGLIPDKYAPVVRAVGLALAAIGRWGAKIPLGVSLKW